MRWRTRIFIGGACLLLGACGGGGGGGVASAPPPAPSPTPTPGPTPAPKPFTLPPTPATTSGTYQAISTVASYTSLSKGEQIAPPTVAPAGAVTLTVDATSKTYTLSVNAGVYSFAARQLTMADTADIGITRNNPQQSGTPDQFTPPAQIARGDLLALAVPNGNDANGGLKALGTVMTLYNVGQMNGSPRYISMAYWAQFNILYPSGSISPDNFTVNEANNGYMVFGPRTAEADLPVSGKATFALKGAPYGYEFEPSDDGSGGTVPPRLSASLAVDFATRQLDASVRGSESFGTYDEAGEVEVARHDIDWLVSGSSRIGAGAGFDMALSGTGAVRTRPTDGSIVADITRTLTGSMTGAFFGPRAEEVGGLWALPSLQVDGTTAVSGLTPFVGQRTQP